VAKASEGVKIHVIDYDDLKADFEKTFSRLSPEAQAYYRRAEDALPHPSGTERS
jgi:hypothetical protein